MRKIPVKTYLTPKQTELLDFVSEALGEDRSGTLRAAFLAYAKEIGAVQHFLVNNPGVLSE